MAARKGPRLYKKQSRTQREKKHVLTLTLMLVRRKSACQTSAGSSKVLRWLTPLLGPNLDPKTGPSKDLKEGMNMWSNSGPHFGSIFGSKNGSAIGEFHCCPHMLCKQIATLQLEHEYECQLIPFSLWASQVRLLLIPCWRLIQLGSQTVLRLISKGKQPCPGIAFIGRNPCLWKHPCGQKPTAFPISPQHPCGPFWDPCEHSGEAHFCAPAFSYVLRSKKSPFFVILFCSNFHSLEALEACLEACSDVFCSNFHGLATLEFKTCIEACLQLCFHLYFWVCCNFHRGLPEAVPLRQLRLKILARQHRHQLFQVQPCWDFNNSII